VDAPGDIVTLTPIADAYARDGNGYASMNFGAEEYLYVKKTPTVGYNRQAYLKFDLRSVTSPRSAALRLTAPDALSTFTVAISSVADTSWDEHLITWNTMPAAGALLGYRLVMAGPRAQYDFDVTSFVQAEVAAGHQVVSFALTSLTGEGAEPIAFWARESTMDPPMLLIGH
jgi:hyaluronate lyase